jgi:hypothetical protein
MFKKTALLFPLLLAAAPALAQLSVPVIGDTLGRVGGVLQQGLDQGLAPVRGLVRGASELAQLRVNRLDAFVHRNRDSVEFDDRRQPARRGEAILLDPDPAAIEAARSEGYSLIEQSAIEGLGIEYARLSLPEGESLAAGLKRLRKLLPGKTVTADELHFMSGSPQGHGGRAAAGDLPGPHGGAVGIIDGGISPSPILAAQRGFAKGAPRPNAHATAIASLLAGAGVDRIWCADVFGSDPAGGDALAIARALGWLVGEGVPVISISLVGPANPLVQKAIAAARQRGSVIVAAVGNDGPAAPPAYPASYPGVVAVTGVDGKGRVLIEAGKASHLDYAAPGADLTAVAAGGKRESLRGTSFAAPLAASRIAAHRKEGARGRALIAAVDAEAVDLGSKGPDKTYGRGLLCGKCREGR